MMTLIDDDGDEYEMLDGQLDQYRDWHGNIQYQIEINTEEGWEHIPLRKLKKEAK